MYTQQQKKRENLLLLNWLKIKFAEFKNCMLHVKLTVYYTVGFICNIHFLNSTHFISINLKLTSFRVSFAAVYICSINKIQIFHITEFKTNRKIF